MGPLLVNYKDLSALTLSGTNKSRAVVGAPIQILQVGFIVTTALTGSTATVTWNICLASGADAAPVGDGALGATTSTSATQAINTGVYLDVPAVAGNRIVYPGEAVEAEVTDTASAGVVTPFFVYAPLGFGNQDLRANVSGHAGSTTHATALAALTSVIA